MVKQQHELRQITDKARTFIKDRKKEWLRAAQLSTMKRFTLNNFPANFNAETLKMHKMNERMYPMLDHVEAAIVKNVEENMENVGEAMHALQN